jgi:hypothetical protein
MYSTHTVPTQKLTTDCPETAKINTTPVRRDGGMNQLLSGCTTGSFSRRAQIHEVSGLFYDAVSIQTT